MESFFSSASQSFVPVMAAVIISYGVFHNAPVYDYFIEGAKNGLKTAVEILPFLIGIYLAVNSLTASGFMSFLFSILKPFFSFIHVPVELLPLIILRAVSGSGSFLIVQDIMETAGPDSYIGRAACVMAGGCETVLYVLALYFSVTSVSRMRHAFVGGMIGYFAGVILSLIIVNFM